MDQLPAFVFYVAVIFGGFAFLALLAEIETKRREREARRVARARRRAAAWRELHDDGRPTAVWGESPADGTHRFG